MRFFSRLKIWEKFKNTCYRFPLGVVIIALLSIIFIYVVHSDSENIEILLQIVSSLILTFFFSIWLVIHGENIKNISQIKKYTLQSIAIIFWILFFCQFNGDLNSFENIIFFILSLLWIIGYVFSAPYLQKKVYPAEVYYNYLYSTLSAFISAYIVWLLIMLLWMIAITSIDALFWITWSITDYLYQYWIILSIVLVTPLFGLSQLPDHTEVHTKLSNINSFARFIIKYLLFPAVCVYFIILYAYSIQLWFTFWNWPKGEISWLIIGFSILGYITYILSYIYTNDNKAIGLFRQYFPYAVIPQVLILFYSIYLRIAQYDLTINRYFIIIFGICLAWLSIYFIYSPAKRLIAFPVSLILVAVIVSMGPWSIYQLPAKSQFHSLKSELIAANILQWDIIIPLKNKADISAELSNSIYTKIKYLCDYHNCYGLKNLFSEYYFWDAKNDTHHLNNWEIIQNITQALQVSSHSHTSQDNYFSFYLDHNESFFPLDVSEYSKIIEIESYNDNDIILNYTQKTLQLSQYPELWNISLDTIFQSIQDAETRQLDISSLSFEVDTSIGKSLLLIKSIGWHTDNSESSFNMSGYILVP